MTSEELARMAGLAEQYRDSCMPLAAESIEALLAEVRSLTVERDHLAMVVEQRKAAGASYREALEKIGTDANDLRARLSRAREALADFDEEQPHYRDGKEAEDNWRARQESALVALRAALDEPLGGS